MRKTMVATAISFLLIGGGVTFAHSSPGGESSPAAGAASSQASEPQGAQQQGTQANRQRQQANGQAPVGFAEEEVTAAPLTVQSIDKKNRNIVVRAPDGTQSTVNIPAGTPGFDSLNKGDKIQLDYFAAAVFGPGAHQANRASQNGSMSGSGSTQASGAANNQTARVRNIRKVNDNGKAENSGKTGETGAKGTSSGSDQGNQ